MPHKGDEQGGQRCGEPVAGADLAVAALSIPKVPGKRRLTCSLATGNAARHEVHAGRADDRAVGPAGYPVATAIPWPREPS